jgi:hypothetical protein
VLCWILSGLYKIFGGQEPLIFNIVTDVFAILIAKEKEDGQVGGLVPHLVDGGVSILQYVDHTIFFMEHDLEKEILN